MCSAEHTLSLLLEAVLRGLDKRGQGYPVEIGGDSPTRWVVGLSRGRPYHGVGRGEGRHEEGSGK